MTTPGSGRDRAIEAAARAWWENGETTATFKRWEELDDRTRTIMRDGMATCLAASVPGLLNDLADSIETKPGEATGLSAFLAGWYSANSDAADRVRAAAAGWGTE